MSSIYKIRHKVTGRYSKGGIYVSANGEGYSWTDKAGKVWGTLGQLRSHITSHMSKYSGATDMSDWEVLEYPLANAKVNTIYDMIDPKKIVALLKK